jgi:hypothetical protein
MRKLFFILLSVFFLTQTAFANIMPRYTTSVNYYGIGILRVSNLTKIYEKQDENSDIIQKIYWDNGKNFKTSDGTKPEDTFIAYIPTSNYAFLSVEDENENWVLVYYNQKTGKTGWVKKDAAINEFYTWADFINTYGRKNGIYAFKDTPREERVLYGTAQEDAQIVDNWEIAKHINPWYINGNWVMVKVLDYDNAQKTGYLKWRTNEGKLLIFVDLK